MPSISILLKLSNEFKVSVEYLLGVNRHYSLDVSELTDEQAVIVNNLVEEFTKNNMNNKNTNSLPAKIRFF